MAAIEAEGLRRTYKTTTGVIRRKALTVDAVRGVSFSVEPGELFGLLGPNGAGPTAPDGGAAARAVERRCGALLHSAARGGVAQLVRAAES